MRENILVTGGAGYLGSILVPALLDAGYHVTVLDNFMYKQNSLAHVCADPHFDVVRGDARDYALVGKLAAKADILIPLACLVGAPLCDADKDAAKLTNFAAVNLLAYGTSKHQRILFPTTNSGYGRSDVPCNEDTPLNPISLYARTKVDAEKAVLNRGNAITFRLATVFGASPRMRIDLLVNDFVYRAVRDRAIVLFEPHFRRNFIHVRDVAHVFLHGITNFEAMKDRPYNVGLSDANLTKLQLCQAIARHLPDFDWQYAKAGNDPDQRDYVVDNSRIEKTGFRPAFSLDDGIAELKKLYATITNERYGNV